MKFTNGKFQRLKKKLKKNKISVVSKLGDFFRKEVPTSTSK